MDARELRIGNWVQLNGKGRALPNLQSAKYYQITRIGKSFAYIEDMHVNDVEALSLIDPVLLTEELLLKMAGIDDELLDDGDNNCLLVPLGNDGVCIDFPLRENPRYAQQGLLINGERMDVPVQYLHQLQNLYFALTGKELEVNL